MIPAGPSRRIVEYGYLAEPADQPADELAPAERGEHWWPVALAIVIVAVLHVALPARYRIQPGWVVPVVLLGLLAVLIAGDPGRIDRQKPWLRLILGITIAFITVATMLAAVRLVADILTNNKLFANHPGGLLAPAPGLGDDHNRVRPVVLGS